MRNADGTFGRGNSAAVGYGRPEAAGKVHIKEMCWDSLNTVVQLVFGMPEVEMKAWFETNKQNLSLAERIFIEASEGNLAVIESLLDRIVGKTLKFDGQITHHDPIRNEYDQMTSEERERRIDELIRIREILRKEDESIEIGVVE